MLIEKPRPAIAHALGCSSLGPVVDIAAGSWRLCQVSSCRPTTSWQLASTRVVAKPELCVLTPTSAAFDCF